MRVTHVPIGLTWQLPAVVPHWGYLQRFEQILAEWEGTKYRSGANSKGEVADCLGFGFGVIDELYRRVSPAIERLPADTALHDPATARAALRVLLRIYQPAEEVTNGLVEPADILITQAPKGGPGHLMLVGPSRNTLWHCNAGVGVQRSGFSLPAEFAQVHSIYRFSDREKWL